MKLYKYTQFSCNSGWSLILFSAWLVIDNKRESYITSLRPMRFMIRKFQKIVFYINLFFNDKIYNFKMLAITVIFPNV